MQDFIVIGIILITVTSVAAITDWRTGVIPNWLTLSCLIAAVIGHGIKSSLSGVFASVIGALISFAVPYLFFRVRAMGGGDVKLFASIGAIAGPSIGLEIELLSLATIYLYGIVVITKQGGLRQTLENSWRVIVNTFLPKHMKRVVESESLTSFRLGGAIFVGTLVCIINRLWLNGFNL